MNNCSGELSLDVLSANALGASLSSRGSTAGTHSSSARSGASQSNLVSPSNVSRAIAVTGLPGPLPSVVEGATIPPRLSNTSYNMSVGGRMSTTPKARSFSDSTATVGGSGSRRTSVFGVAHPTPSLNESWIIPIPLPIPVASSVAAPPPAANAPVAPSCVSGGRIRGTAQTEPVADRSQPVILRPQIIREVSGEALMVALAGSLGSHMFHGGPSGNQR